MGTLISAIFYLWLVLTFLLGVMWIIKELDRRRGGSRSDARDDDMLSEVLPDRAQETEPDVAAEPEPEVSAEVEAEPEPDPDPVSEPEQEPEPELADVTLEELLDGVALPDELIAVTEHVADPKVHLIFLSDHPDAAEVGTAFADALSDQGFEIEPAGFDQAIAHRDGQMLSLRISPDAGTVLDEDSPRYVGAGESDVAIEVWVGNGSPPPLAG